MRKRRYTEAQIVEILQELDAHARNAGCDSRVVTFHQRRRGSTKSGASTSCKSS